MSNGRTRIYHRVLIALTADWHTEAYERHDLLVASKGQALELVAFATALELDARLDALPLAENEPLFAASWTEYGVEHSWGILTRSEAVEIFLAGHFSQLSTPMITALERFLTAPERAERKDFEGEGLEISWMTIHEALKASEKGAQKVGWSVKKSTGPGQESPDGLYATLSWTPDDVCNLFPGASREAAESWLARNESEIRRRLIEVGFGIMHAIESFDPIDPKPEGDPNRVDSLLRFLD